MTLLAMLMALGRRGLKNAQPTLQDKNVDSESFKISEGNQEGSCATFLNVIS